MDLAGNGLRVVERRLQGLLPLNVQRVSGDPAARARGESVAGILEHGRRNARALHRPARRDRRSGARADAGDAAQCRRGRLDGRDPGDVESRRPGEPVREALDAGASRPVGAVRTVYQGDYLDGWFESAPIKAAYGFDGVVGNYASPFTPGSGYVLLHHVLGEVNGKKGSWGHAIGGMGAITQAMAKACAALGVDIRTDAPVKEVIVEGGSAVGVATEAGEVFRARMIASNLNPKLLFLKLVDKAVLPDDFRERIEHYRCGSGTFRMNVALSELPRFTCKPQDGDHMTAGIIIAPSLDYMDRAYNTAREKGWSTEPIVEVLIPSTLDDSLAPKGQHVASMFCQQVAPTLPDGRSWDDAREEVADLMIATVDRMAPGFKASVVGRQILSPLDLERTFGLVGGDIMHGVLSLDQLYSARPVLGHGNYRSPVPGLYMCGSGTHPGGGVSGAPGHNAAREMIRDRRR